MLKQLHIVPHTRKTDISRTLRGDFLFIIASVRVSAHGRLPVQTDVCMAFLTSLSKHQKHTSSLTLPSGWPEERYYKGPARAGFKAQDLPSLAQSPALTMILHISLGDRPCADRTPST